VNVAWSRIASSDLLTPVTNTLNDIDQALQTPQEFWFAQTVYLEPDDGIPATLSHGFPGISLYFAARHRERGDLESRSCALSYLNLTADLLARQTINWSLYSGFVGFLWSARQVERLLGEPVGYCSNEEIDSALLGLVEHGPWAGQYDLMSGLVGMGVYFLERLDDAEFRRGLEWVVDRIAEQAIYDQDGASWVTPPGWLDAERLFPVPEGFRNLGMAHGIPAVLALLGKVREHRIALETVDTLLDQGVAWLMARKTEGSELSLFPRTYVPGRQDQPAHLGWCYGDLGIALALLGLARRCSRADWESQAIEVAERVLRRTDATPSVSLCHGSAGIAHLFNRLYQATGSERFGEAARYWIRRTLEARRPYAGVAGFISQLPNPRGENGWPRNPGLLNGAAGVGLSLLASIGRHAPTWDSLFLADLPDQVSTWH